MSKTPEEMAEEYAELMSFDVRGHQRGFLTGYKAAQQWISVKDRLPDDGVEVIVVKDGKSYPAWHETGPFGWSVGGKVTHWMPLPEAPKEEK